MPICRYAPRRASGESCIKIPLWLQTFRAFFGPQNASLRRIVLYRLLASLESIYTMV